jgi:hypothetical protein
MSDIVERLRERSQNLWTTDAELRSNQLFKDAAAEIERLRAALEQIDHGWENPMDDKAHRALCRFMWETARAALAQEKPHDR